MNPMNIFQMKGIWDKFQSNHPRFPQFLQAVTSNGIHEDTIIDITVTEPDGEKIQSNLKISASDMQLFEELKQLSANMK